MLEIFARFGMDGRTLVDSTVCLLQVASFNLFHRALAVGIVVIASIYFCF